MLNGNYEQLNEYFSDSPCILIFLNGKINIVNTLWIFNKFQCFRSKAGMFSSYSVLTPILNCNCLSEIVGVNDGHNLVVVQVQETNPNQLINEADI